MNEMRSRMRMKVGRPYETKYVSVDDVVAWAATLALDAGDIVSREAFKFVKDQLETLK